ncbi:MAG: prepilin-type N-terminal cleavage/methylation domain-containing protein [Syntrophales bacterium]
MRILRTGLYNKGFSLLELIIVIFIVSLTFALSFPYITITEEEGLRSEARKITSILRYLNDSAISTKETYAIKIDFKAKELSYKGPDGERAEKFVNLVGIDLQTKGMVSDGKAVVFLGPTGSTEGFTMHLRSDKNTMAVIFNPLSGRVKILDHYS